MNDGITLYELLNRVKGSIEENFSHYYWVRAQVSAIKANYSGHCYIDLIDKGDKGADFTAKSVAIVWSSTWRILKPFFRSATGGDIEAGMNILLKVQVQYSELYGLSLIVSDIDPTFTIGQAELERREVIRRLEEEGMFDMNTTLTLPHLPKRFAVISAQNAAGYRDFYNHLHLNDYGYRFYTKLYTAPLQGNTAPSGIIAALDAILSDVECGAESFDAVLILRGGGSNTDLACFDNYDLCANVAQYPLPVMVAIGHDQDKHICDMVSCVSVKTPTALADFIIDIFASEDALLVSLASRLTLAMKNKFSEAEKRLDSINQRIAHRVSSIFSEKRSAVALLEQRIIKGNPRNLLKGGYCVTEVEGRRVSSIGQVPPEGKLKVIFEDGVAECKVENVVKTNL